MEKIIKVRFNTAYPSSSPYKWRVLVDDIQYLVDGIHLNCNSWSSLDIVKEDGTGNDIEKHHVSCSAKTVSIEEKNGELIANIN